MIVAWCFLIYSLLATGSNEDLLEAAKLLSKRDDAEALSLATEMACKAGATEFASNLSLYCVRVCLLQNKWEAASEKLSAYSFGDSEVSWKVEYCLMFL